MVINAFDMRLLPEMQECPCSILRIPERQKGSEMNFPPCNVLHDPRVRYLLEINDFLNRPVQWLDVEPTVGNYASLILAGVNYSADMFSAILIITLKYTERERERERGRESERTYHTFFYVCT